MLQVSSLTYRIAGRLLIDNASVTIPSGAKTGLVGRNGVGKSTLFKLLCGELSVESGSVHMPQKARIGQVAQEAPGTQDSLLAVVLAADTERTDLLAEAETAQDAHRISEIHTRLADIESHSAEARASAILSGLGFSHDEQQQPCANFSGGWRMRVALAALLFSKPDLMLLDEPTNYLDLEGTMWLENFIARYPYQVLLISHDRDLLNNAVDSIVHMDGGKLTFYRGGYDSFDRQRRETIILQKKAAEKQDKARKHIQSFVDRFRAKASKAKQAQSRIKMLEKMQPISVLDEGSGLELHIPQPEAKLSPPIIKLEQASVGYDDKTILSNLTLNIDHDDRIALLGANGNGKSTFAKLIAGRLGLMSGEMAKATKLSTAFFAQHQLDDLMPESNPIEHVRPLMPGAMESKIRARVDRFGLPTDRMMTPAKDLSGGEKARLLLGLATFHGPNLVILDEPTNHLDIDSREALVHAINDYDGAVILISHDRHLVEACADRLWLVADGGVKDFDGDMAAYRKLILKGDSSSKSKSVVEEDSEKANAQARRKEAAERRAKTAPLKKNIEAAEKEISKYQKYIKKLDALLADPRIYTEAPDKAKQHAIRRAAYVKVLGETEEKWLGMSAELEELSAG
ncbi:putative ABC transporter ATP-binding protein YheS [Pseudovibrio axinellae]|uniref:Putative ABC transporter ATP-binding protein YheS n=1 Tax=Pseudovibrio axinellae TaxID=989403 RepID=A0A165ULF4_9HYPH|nr:ABC-F family ATP-binding cassette domain-containing protein [Pseudovibrio axinellae]KZL12510.1 putative ABC transporter ATP-binding protein YheS [Pseudovibrio axinellae]SEP69109.1 ATP-binding cassette, subfamily F, member 3 [Pseudovibrio axinellae]